VEDDAREARQRELVVVGGGGEGMREVLPYGEEDGVAEGAAGEEDGVERAARVGDAGRPREEGVGDDADRGQEAGDEPFEGGAEGLRRLEEGDELVDVQVGEGLGAGGRPWSAGAKGSAWRRMGGVVAGRVMEGRRRAVETSVTVMPGRSSWRRAARRRKAGMWPRARKGKRTTCRLSASSDAMAIA
jgi:hypothetical protein